MTTSPLVAGLDPAWRADSRCQLMAGPGITPCVKTSKVHVRITSLNRWGADGRVRRRNGSSAREKNCASPIRRLLEIRSMKNRAVPFNSGHLSLAIVVSRIVVSRDVTMASGTRRLCEDHRRSPGGIWQGAIAEVWFAKPTTRYQHFVLGAL